MSIRKIALTASLALLICIALGIGCAQETGNYDGPVVGQVTGQVTDTNGSGIAGVKVGIPGTTHSAVTDANGFYNLTDVAPAANLILSFASANHTASYARLSLAGWETRTANARVLSRANAQQLDASTGGRISGANNAAVTMPANAFVDSTGRAVSGQVDLQITYLNPSTDQLLAGPGDLTAINARGEQVGLMSYGMVEITASQLLGNGNTEMLQFGQTGMVEIPIPTLPEYQNLNINDTVPLWYFNPTLAQWEERGTGTVQWSTENPTQMVYAAPITFVGWWNCDRVPALTCISGQVLDVLDLPVVGAQVKARGLNYNGVTTANTDENGVYRIWPVAVNAQVSLNVSFSYRGQSYSASRTPVATSGSAVPSSGNCGGVEPIKMDICTIASEVNLVEHKAAQQDGFSTSDTPTLNYVYGSAVFYVPNSLNADQCTAGFFNLQQNTCRIIDSSESADFTAQTRGLALNAGANVTLSSATRSYDLALGSSAAYQHKDNSARTDPEFNANYSISAPGQAGGVPHFDATDKLYMPNALQVVVPQNASHNSPLNFTWTAGSSTGNVVLMLTGTNGKTVGCRCSDSGSFTVPAEFSTQLGTGQANIVSLRVENRTFALPTRLNGVAHGMAGYNTSFNLR